MWGAFPHDNRIRYSRDEAIREEQLRELLEPRTRALLQPIDSLLEETHLRRLPLSNVPGRLLHEYLLIKVSVKKGIGHVQLMKRPGLIQSNREENTDGAEARHRRECIMIVKTIGLRKATSHETRLVTSDGAIRIVLEGVHPLAGDNIGINRLRNQRPCLPLDEGRILHIHRRFPRRYLQRLNIRLGN